MPNFISIPKLLLISLLPTLINGHEDPIEDLANMNFGFIQKLDYVTYSKVSVHLPKSKSSLIMAKQNKKQGDAISRIPGSQDSFLLELDAYNKTFCMHLHPNYDLVHPEASYVTQGATLMGRVLKKKLEAKAYRGFVVAVADHQLGTKPIDCDEFKTEPAFENYGETRGWARLVLSTNTFQSRNLRRRSEQPTTAPEFEGVFMADGVIYIVKTIQRYRITRRNKDIPLRGDQSLNEDLRGSRMIIYRHQDIRLPDDASDELRKNHSNHHFCGSDTLEWNADQRNGAEHFHQQKLKAWHHMQSLVAGITPAQQTNMLVKRSTVPQGCPTTQKVLYMGVALDCSYIRYHGGENNARQQTINNFNIVSGIYAQDFNINIGLIEILAWPTCGSNPVNADCTSGTTIQQRLSLFSNWRGSYESPAGLWHLMSNCSTMPTIGIAWMNQLCVTKAFAQVDSGGNTQYVTGVGISTPTATEHMVIAHEIGHNFGAAHDCNPSLCSGCSSDPCPKCCPCTSSLGTCSCNGYFIMHPSSDVNTINPGFSACSKKTMCTNSPIYGTCLSDPGKHQVLNGNICGNGIREGNEECDCGGTSLCANHTCCFANCTLRAGAVCSDGNDGCCRNCQVIPAATNYTCRAAAGECDVAEVCTGTKECPKDVFRSNGIPCGNSSNVYCATGQCTNRENQCKAYGGFNYITQAKTSYVSDCPFMSGQCMMFCQDSFGICGQVGGDFRDGTKCGNNGECTGGVCSNPDFLGDIIQWIMTNKNIAMVIGIVGGVILIVLVYTCLKSVKTGRSSEQAKLDAAELIRYERYMKERAKRHAAAAAAAATGGVQSGDDRSRIQSSAIMSGANNARRQSTASAHNRR